MSLYRIGTASRRSGLPIATLRNWELRYGLVTAIRTPGGQRRRRPRAGPPPPRRGRRHPSG